METKGRTLEETAALFDGEQPQQDLVQRGGEAATMNMGRAHYSRKDDLATDFLEMRPVSVSTDTVDDLSICPLDHGKDAKNRLYSLPHRDNRPYFIEAV